MEVSLEEETFPEITLFDEPLRASHRAESSLEIAYGAEENTRRVALSKTSRHLSFLPSYGERPLLIIPSPQLLCPPGLELNVELVVALNLRLAITSKTESHLITEWSAPFISRGMYGTAEQAQICTCIHSPVAGSADELINLYSEHPILGLHLLSGRGPDEKTRFPCWARLPLTVVNSTSEPLEINKIFIPTAPLSLAQSPDGSELLVNPITLQLLAPQAAMLTHEIFSALDQGYRPLIKGRTLTSDRRSHIRLNAFRTRTGLEYGF